mmetsp:Transcript_35892/g.65874  ORF Transcript_35892/g.65874 Transcript_35892/m.65874 type:complete len:533 (-) Transcript_35892:151-1749(-)
MAEKPTTEGSGEAGDVQPQKRHKDSATFDDAAQMHVVAKKSSGAVGVELTLSSTATVSELVTRLADHEGCDKALITLVCRGAVLKEGTVSLQQLADKEKPDAKLVVVYLVRKAPAAQEAAPAQPQPAAAGTQAVPSASSSSAPPAAAPSVQPSAGEAGTAQPGSPTMGQHVLLLIRHGQCCHDSEGDELKGLTQHGHQQADESARYVAQLFAASKLPEQRALLHSTSRRARETAAKLPNHLPGLGVWNADILRETDPTKNALRAEDVFIRLFAVPPEGAKDTLIVVAHNNIILYLLMRAAGVPIERAAQAWRLFHLRHASVTRIDVLSSGQKQVVCVGAAGHIPSNLVTWNNIAGADMAAWRDGQVHRHKFSGRMILLVRLASAGLGMADLASRQIEMLASHIESLKEYMVSSHAVVTCTPAGEVTAAAVARRFKTAPQIFPQSITEQPEAAFLQFFCSATERSRDTIVMVAEDGPVLYWLLRALHLSQEEAKAAIGSYCIGPCSVTLVNVKADGVMKVVAVGDTGHLPMEC